MKCSIRKHAQCESKGFVSFENGTDYKADQMIGCWKRPDLGRVQLIEMILLQGVHSKRIPIEKVTVPYKS